MLSPVETLPGIIPDKPSRESLSQTLSWDLLLSHLKGDDSVKQSILNLEINQNTVEAIASLGQVLDDRVARWLFHQLVVLSKSRDLFEQWVRAHKQSDTKQDTIDSDATLVRIVVHDDVRASASPSSAETRLRDLWLAKNERWQELSSGLAQRESRVDRLVAAHIVGDHLEDRHQQIHMLNELSRDASLLNVEELIEASLCESLERTIPQANVELILEVEAIAVYLGILSDSHAQRDHLPLDEASSAWQRLSSLLLRQEDASDLADLYANEAEGAHQPLSDVLRLRAAELFMAGGQWARALAVLPPNDSDDLIGKLSGWYACFALIGSRSWSALGALWLDLSGAKRSAAELRASLLIASKQPETAQPVIDRVASSIAEVSDSEAGLLRALLLAVCRLRRDSSLLDQLLSTYADTSEDLPLRGILNYWIGVRKLAASDPDQAAASFSHAREDLGDDAMVIAGQALSSLSASAYADRAASFVAELSELATPKGRVALLRLSSQLEWADGNLDGCSSLTRQLISDNPLDVSALLQHAAVLLQLGQQREAAETLANAAPLLDSPDNTYCAIGDLFLLRLDDSEEAEKSYREVIERNPLHPGALHGLRQIYASTERWRELLTVLDSLLQLANTNAQRLKLQVNSLNAARQLYDDDDSFEENILLHCNQILSLDPTNGHAVDSLLLVCERTGRWTELTERKDLLSKSLSGLRALCRAATASSDWQLLAEANADLTEYAPDHREAKAAALAAADTYAKHLGDQQRAEHFFRAVLQLDPSDVVTLRRFADLLRSDGPSEKLAEVLEQLWRLSRGDERNAIRTELETLYADDSIKAPETATTEHLRAVLSQDPTDIDALREYDLALEKEDNTAERVSVLERLMQNAQGREDLCDTLIKLAGVYRELDDDRGLSTVVTQLQRFADEPEAVVCLEQILLTQKRYRELCEFYERQVHVLVANGLSDQAAEMLQRKGMLELLHLKAESAAVETFLHLLKLRPGDEHTLRRLEEILRGLGDFQRLVTLFETYADSADNDAERLTALHRAAETAHSQLQDEAETFRLYERIYQLSPTDHKAFSVLQKKLERENDHRRLVELLLEQVEVAEGESQLEILLRAAAVCEKSNLEQAVLLYGRALKIKEDSPSALDALARLYESLERWDELLEVTKQQVQLGGKPARIALLYFKMGSVIETQHQDDDEAFRYYTEALRQYKSCLPALHGLRDLHARRNEWHKVVQTLEAEAAVWSEAKGKADVLAQAAEVYATKLADRATAMKRYEQAIRIHRECMPAALALFEHYAAQGRFADAAAWGKVYARRGRTTQEHRARFLVRWADVLAKLDKSTEAAEALVKALSLRPGEPTALFGLLVVCRKHPDAFAFGEAFDEMLQDAGDGSLEAAILSAGIGVLAEKRGDVKEALRLYHRAIEIGGPQFRLIEPLADLLVATGNDQDARELVSRALQDDTAFDEWLAATLWLARFCSHFQADYAKAITLYQQALKRQPNLGEPRVQMARCLYLSEKPQEAYEALTAACSQLASRSPEDLEHIAELYHATGLAAMAAGNLKAAETNLRRACEYAPHWPYPYLALAKKRLAAGDPEAAERELKLADQQSPKELADVLRAQAEFFGRRGHVEHAIDLYRKAVKLGDSDIDDRVNLGGYLLQSENPAEAVSVLQGIIQEEQRRDYLPAYEQLGHCYKALGQFERTRRALQVIRIATGRQNPQAEPPPPLPVIKSDSWNVLGRDLSDSPIDQIWRLLADPLRRRLPDLPRTSAPTQDLGRLSTEVSQLTGTKFTIAIARLDVPALASGSLILFSHELESADFEALRAHAVMAAVAHKLGYGDLVSLTVPARRKLAALLATLLLPESHRSKEATDLLSRDLLGKTKRTLARIQSQHATSQSRATQMANVWMNAIDDLCWRVVLLVTENLETAAKGAALRAGLSCDEPFQGGLLHASSDVARMAQYYVSDAFERQKALLRA